MERVTVVNTLSPILLRNGVDTEEEEEISIFEAKKYFDETGMEQNRVVSPAKKIGLDRIGDDLRNYGVRSLNATPTASSEASWNSQTGLLKNPPGGCPVKLRSPDKNRGSTKARWLFGRKCPCSGKKSVEVENNLSPEPRTHKLRSSASQTSNSKSVLGPDSLKPDLKSERLETETISISQTPRTTRFSTTAGFHSERVSAPPATGFTFPILGQSKLALPPLDPPRDSVESLEVFRPSNHKQNQHRQVFTFPTAANPKLRAAIAVDDDVASDASSDLFEIESFSTQTTAMGPHRDSLEESVVATECYEPSEASIDWSVTTAEGFDRGSLTNYSSVAYEEVLFERGGAGGGGAKRRSGNHGLLSCRCEKAVSVGPQPVARWVPPTRHAGDWATGGFSHNKPPSGLTRTAT